jgi:hypothetical protein
VKVPGAVGSARRYFCTATRLKSMKAGIFRILDMFQPFYEFFRLAEQM